MNKPICKLARAYLDKMCLICVPWRHKTSQRRACIDSRMLYTTVASLCQTLCATTSKRILRPSPSISGIALQCFFIIVSVQHWTSPEYLLPWCTERDKPGRVLVMHIGLFHMPSLEHSRFRKITISGSRSTH